ncbi:MAG: aminopeptidase P family protein [Actinobacteria bacterium]|nr:MAG: aminopeptidase P family protein [Actinomycetota bacterium]
MANRLKALRRLMRDAYAEAFLIKKPENIYYLSGLKTTEASLLLTTRTLYLIVDSRYYLKAKKTTNLSVLLLEGKLESFLKSFLKEKSINKLAFESNFLTFKQVKSIKGKTKLIEADGWVEKIRQVKTDTEINIIKHSAKLADKAISFDKHSVSLGMSEIQLAKKIECFIRQKEGRGESFETIVASGPNSALPHYTSGKRSIKPGDALLIDMGVKYKNYVSDITRTFLLEPVKPTIKKMYLTCLRAQENALKKVQSAVNTKEVDKEARDYIEKYYPSKFEHNLGHGLGLEIHEEPVVGPKSNSKLSKNMVITVEPGIYIEGKGGVRIEDMVLIKDNGKRILTKSPKNIEDIIIEL